jgi:hypothetical protein
MTQRSWRLDQTNATGQRWKHIIAAIFALAESFIQQRVDVPLRTKILTQTAVVSLKP